MTDPKTVTVAVFYFLAAGGLTVFGLLCLLKPRAALKLSRMWSTIPRKLRPDAAWDALPPATVPSRPIGFVLFLIGLFLVLQPLSRRGLLNQRSTSTGARDLLHTWPSLIFALALLSISVFMLVDPLGLWCFFLGKNRQQYPEQYKRTPGAIFLALIFLGASLFLLFSLFVK